MSYVKEMGKYRYNSKYAQKKQQPKNRLEMWWKTTFPQNLVLFGLVVCEKRLSTNYDDDWTMDASPTTIALLTVIQS